MRVAWAALVVLLLVPAAEACSLRQYRGTVFDPLEWRADGRLRYDRGGYDWVEHDLANGSIVRVESRHFPEAPEWVTSPFLASAAGADLAIEPLRGPPSGAMTAGCWGSGADPGRVYGYRLVRNATELRRWALDDNTTAWTGTVWQNATHGFVWDRGESSLSSVRWADARVDTFDTVLEGGTDPYWSASPDIPPHLLGDHLVLAGRSHVVLLDPGDGSARRIDSPFAANATADDHGVVVRGGSAFFSHWTIEGEDVSQRLARVDLASGQRMWTVDLTGNPAYTDRVLAEFDGQERTIRLFLDGTLREEIAVPGLEPPVFAQQGDRIAIGIPGHAPRLIVLGAAMERLHDGRVVATPSTSPDTWTQSDASGTDGGGEDDGEDGDAPGPGEDGRGAPAAPFGLAALAVAAAMAALRRRLG